MYPAFNKRTAPLQETAGERLIQGWQYSSFCALLSSPGFHRRACQQYICVCRFSYCALSCCSLLGNLQAVNVPQAVSYIVSCHNIDGGFGCTAGVLSLLLCVNVCYGFAERLYKDR